MENKKIFIYTSLTHLERWRGGVGVGVKDLNNYGKNIQKNAPF